MFLNSTRLELCKGKIILPSNIKSFMIKIGINKGSFNLSDGKKQIWRLDKNGVITFKGNCTICAGCCIVVHDSAILTFGRNFQANSNFLVVSSAYILFGDNVLIGWNCTVIDGDGHKLYMNDKRVNPPASITVGEHCWIAANVSLLKGTEIANNCVIGYGSIVSGKFKADYSLIAGAKAKVRKENIVWKE